MPLSLRVPSPSDTGCDGLECRFCSNLLVGVDSISRISPLPSGTFDQVSFSPTSRLLYLIEMFVMYADDA
jgi:hypothetical protein